MRVLDGEGTKAIVDKAVQTLAEDLEKGQSEAMTRYLQMIHRFRRYSIGNLFAILAQRPDATMVQGYCAWQKLGRQIKSGQRGIRILAPMRLRFPKDGEDGDSTEKGDNTIEQLLGFRTAIVFDVQQTEGRPLPTPPEVKGNPGEYPVRLSAYAREHAITVEYGDTGSAEGYSAGGKIVVRTGMTPAQECSVLVHELAHECLHRDGTQISRAAKEAEAEAVAYAVCTGIGLECGSACSDYVKTWRGTKELLLASLTRIRSTAVEILNALLDEPKQMAAPIPQSQEAPLAMAA